MTAVNDFLAFATGGGANVMDQADYAAATFVGTGFEPGLAQSIQLNKVWRQSSFMSAVLAQMIANETGSNVLDDGDINGKVALLFNAIQITAGIRPTRVVNVSTALTVNLTDYYIGLNRTAAPAATAAQLPTPTQAGQEFVIEDLKGNFFNFPVTVSPPAGHTIAGNSQQVCNIDRGSWKFTFYGTTLWSVAKCA